MVRGWRAIKRWWSNPPLDKPIFQIGYFFSVMAGLVTLAFPPSTIKNELGPYMSIAWAFMFIIGGVIGMLTIYTDRWKEERLGIKFIGLGLMVYTAVILTLHVTEPGSRLTQIGMIALAALLFVARYRQIKDWDIEPPKRLYQ